ncbi:MAG: patatin-like phospholipase family protein [Saprospiraceae bacterium]|nr:patatin-like phospholipase family protein [Saprospiraceae bacterium]
MASTLLEKLNRPGPKRILSLDGGGIRGVLTLGFLERMESILRKQHNNPDLLLCDYFDLIGGTSTGSIIAGCLAIGMSASEIKKSYLELGNVIFGKKKGVLNYLSKSEKYDAAPLNKALEEVFGDILIGDQERIKTGLCIVTKRADTFSTWPIINHPDAKYYNENKDFPLWQVIRASAAAPTYFLPLVLEVGPNEKGVFVDGGISMANNPSLQLFLIATLKGFPFHWQMGPEKMMMVSVGTGNLSKTYRNQSFSRTSIMTWASLLPEIFMHDANHFNQLILQIISNSPTAIRIDSEIGDLKQDSLNGKHALTYLRYNVDMNHHYLETLGLQYDAKEVIQLAAMDNARNIPKLAEIGELSAEQLIKTSHFPEHFSLLHKPKENILRITQSKKWDLPFERVVKKEIPVQAVQINEPFEVETIEGILHAKAGDYLMRGVRGEYYAIDQEIFHQTYEKY